MGLNRTERKILFYNKLKAGMSKDEAYKAVANDIEQLKKVEEDKKKNKPKIDFKTEFEKLKTK